MNLMIERKILSDLKQDPGSKIILLCELSIGINQCCLTAWWVGTEHVYEVC